MRVITPDRHLMANALPTAVAEWFFGPGLCDWPRESVIRGRELLYLLHAMHNLTGIPLQCAYALFAIESDFRPNALSKKAAYGIAQVCAPALREFCSYHKMHEPYTLDNMYVPSIGALVGCWYYMDQYATFQRYPFKRRASLEAKAYMAYNGGYQNVVMRGFWVPALERKFDRLVTEYWSSDIYRTLGKV